LTGYRGINEAGKMIRRWGDRLYRSFRLYLWGSAYAFSSHGLEAFRVVLERPLLPYG
jgi:cyclopropane-fatty-acyl-phospholipid synthase